MKTFQYQILRYTHDKLTGEFVNVGVVVFSPELNFLQAEVITKYRRISQFYGEFDGHFLLQTLKNIKLRFQKLALNPNNFAQDIKFENLTSAILPKDDSALYFTETKYSLDLDPEIFLKDVFQRLVDKFNKDDSVTANPDAKAWKNVYKRYFEKYHLIKKLSNHTVKTSLDEIKFDKAWKNGVWHCYQTVSFDLQTSDAIKEKVYKWAGKINQLQTSQEELKLFLLTSDPKKHAELQSFIDTILDFKSNQKVDVRIVKESEADHFALEVKNEMEHSKSSK